jgi:hypothetical protein
MTRLLVDVFWVVADLRMFAYGIPRTTSISDPLLEVTPRVLFEAIYHSSMANVKYSGAFCSRNRTTKIYTSRLVEQHYRCFSVQPHHAHDRYKETSIDGRQACMIFVFGKLFFRLWVLKLNMSLADGVINRC